MKRLSIKLRVTLWFTLFLCLLAAVILISLFSVAKILVANVSEVSLVNIIHDGFHQIEYDSKRDRIEIDDDLDYFQNGVYVAVYDKDGDLLYGKLPRSFQVKPLFVDGEIQTVLIEEKKWYIYDAFYSFENHAAVWVRGVMPFSGSGNIYNTMIQLAAVVLPFFVLFVSLGGYYMLKRAFLPVRQITQAAERIGDGNDLSQRIGLGSGKDEIYSLAATFDHMFDRLFASFEREKQFTSDASHELRTPLAVVMSQCEYALEDEQLNTTTREAFLTILKQTKRMSAMVAQLLLLSRADAGHAKINLELLDVSELLEMVIVQMEDAASQKNITIESNIQPEICLVGDETLLMRLFLNLLENGIKYGKENGHLHIDLTENDSMLTGVIRDDGIGIHQENLERIWERFFQEDAVRGSDKEGMGLGLSMVKYIVKVHGGTIDVNSEYGIGTTFIFKLPKNNNLFEK